MGILYDYEYNSAFVNKLINVEFISTDAMIMDGREPLEEKLISLWNRWLGFLPGAKIAPKNIALSSARRLFEGEPHKPSSLMLELGMDAPSLGLLLATESDRMFTHLSDFLKLMQYQYRLAESNERAVESTYFVYLIANKYFGVLKDVVVLVGFLSFVFIMVIVK